MRSVKKIICNSPAERLAEAGDALLLGYFEGAREVLTQGVLPAGGASTEYTKAVIAAEQEYISGREALRARCIDMMTAANAALVEAERVTNLGL